MVESGVKKTALVRRAGIIRADKWHIFEFANKGGCFSVNEKYPKVTLGGVMEFSKIT